MTLYSYSFQNTKRDLSDILSTVVKDEPRFISNFKPAPAAKARKHEWLQDSICGRSIIASAANSSGVLTVSAGDAAKVKVGTMVTMKNDPALFLVTAISGTSVTVDMVSANGSSLTDATIPAGGGVFNIVSLPQAEATSNGDGEQSYHQSETDYNTLQIFRKEIVLSGSAMAIGVYGNVDNQINRQTAFALGELARDLNRVALFGRRVEGTAAVNGEAGGLYYFATGTGALGINAAGNMFDSFMVNDAAQMVLSEGGNPMQILCSPSQARVLSNEYKDRLQILRSDDKRGAYVAVIVNDINGSGMTIMADPDIPDTDAWLIDPAGFGLSNLNGRAITDEDATPKGFDGILRLALGELTFEFKNAMQRCCRIRGLQASASALAAIKAGIPRRMELTNQPKVDVASFPVPVATYHQITVNADADVPAAAAANIGLRVLIGTAWTEGTKIVTAVKDEVWASNGTAWIKQ